VDNEFAIDLPQILEIVNNADVIIFRFWVVHQRLLFDARYSESEGPLVKVVPRARSAGERFRAIKELRPRFRLPDKITAIWWPRSVRSLITTGVWDAICQRVARTGSLQSLEQCREALSELLRLERTETIHAILGHDSYHTLWARTY